MLPHDRIDFQTAQVSLLIARTAGNKDAEFKDFYPDWSGYNHVESDDSLLAKLTAFRDEHVKR